MITKFDETIDLRCTPLEDATKGAEVVAETIVTNGDYSYKIKLYSNNIFSMGEDFTDQRSNSSYGWWKCGHDNNSLLFCNMDACKFYSDVENWSAAPMCEAMDDLLFQLTIESHLSE